MVVKLVCSSCGTEVNGEFDLCPVCSLEQDSRELFDLFLEARGNLKEVQRKLGVSYPTTRQRIEGMFAELEGGTPAEEPADILRRLGSGEIDVETALELLEGE